MSEYNIDEGSVLSEINRFDLDRGPTLGRLLIDVHRIIAGGESNTFIAVPNLLIRSAEDKYIVTGSSVEEALKNCLDLVKGVPSSSIIPEYNPETSK